MGLDLTPALLVLLVLPLVVAVRWLMRRRTPRSSGPLPDVPDAPPSAEPTAVWRNQYWGIHSLDFREGEDRTTVERADD